MEWPLVRLDSLYDIARGGSPRPIKDYITEDSNGINWVKIGDATASGKFIYETKQKIKPEGIQRSRLVNKGDFILSNSMSFGRPYIMGTSGCIHDGWLVLSAKDERIDQDFLYHMLGSPFVFNQFDALAAGSTVRNLNINLVSCVEIPLLPIAEQKRIVALLDTVFADLEQTRAKTEQNLKNARELFDSYLQQIFSQKGEGWVETTLGSEINLLTGFAFKSKEYVTHSDSTPLIRGDNIVQGKLRWDGVKRWSNDTVSDYEKYQLEADDIVIAMDRTWVKAGMKFSKITSEDLPALLVQRVARLRALDSINSDYLYHLVGSKLFENYVLSIQTGLGVPHISGKQIQAFSFNKPDVEQQAILVSTMNVLKNEVNSLEVIYQKKLAAIDELKKSILQKAFSGELTSAAK